MLNQVVIVGRIVKTPKLDDSGAVKVLELTLAVPRLFKNEEGVYDTDFISCKLYKGIAENVVEYCKKGDLVGVKGRLACLESNQMNVIAEKVTFLSTNKK